MAVLAVVAQETAVIPPVLLELMVTVEAVALALVIEVVLQMVAQVL
jgi:hypothetical protein